MKFSLYLYSGLLISEDINYCVVKNQDGEVGILDNHLPIVITCPDGHLKLIQGQNQLFVVVRQAVVKYENHEITCMATIAAIGKTLEEAKIQFESELKRRLDITRKQQADFSVLENKLKGNITNIKAGELSND